MEKQIKKTVLLQFVLNGEPNEAQLTAIELDGNSMSFKGFSGFAAMDIYDLVTGKGETKDE